MPLVALIALLATACSEPPEPAAVLGTGEYEWSELDDGDDLDVIWGPQGGYHVLVSVRTKGIEAGDPDDLTDPSNPITDFAVLVDGTDIVLTGEYVQGLEPIGRDQAPWTHEMVGRFATLDIEDDDDLVGADLHVEVTVRDADGLEVTDHRDVVAVKYWAND